MKFKDFSLKEKVIMIVVGPWLLIGGLIKTLYRGIRFNDWE